MAPAHLVVETNGKQCGVRQEEEYDDERMEVVLSFIDPEGAGNACSLYRGSSTLCSERLDHEGALMVNFKGTCAATEQYEPFKVLKGLSFFRTVGRRTDGWAGALGRRWLGLTHGRTVRRWTLGHREGRVSGRTGGQTYVTDGPLPRTSVGRSGGRGGRSTVGWEVNRTDSRGGRTHGQTADGRQTEKGSGQTVGRTGGPTGWDMIKVKEAGQIGHRPCNGKVEGTSGTNTDRCVVRVDAKKRCSSWPISGRKPAMPNWVEDTSDFFAVESKA